MHVDTAFVLDTHVCISSTYTYTQHSYALQRLLCLVGQSTMFYVRVTGIIVPHMKITFIATFLGIRHSCGIKNEKAKFCFDFNRSILKTNYHRIGCIESEALCVTEIEPFRFRDHAVRSQIKWNWFGTVYKMFYQLLHCSSGPLLSFCSKNTMCSLLLEYKF